MWNIIIHVRVVLKRTVVNHDVSSFDNLNEYTQIGPAFYFPQSGSVTSHFILIHYKQKPKRIWCSHFKELANVLKQSQSLTDENEPSLLT